MIDHPITTPDLMAKLEAALPIPARLTPELQVSLRGQNAASSIPTAAIITLLYYTGDEGGILCKLDLGRDVEKETFIAITICDSTRACLWPARSLSIKNTE